MPSIWFDVVLPSIAATVLTLVSNRYQGQVVTLESAKRVNDLTDLFEHGEIKEGNLLNIPKDSLVIIEGKVEPINNVSIKCENADAHCVIYESTAVRHMSRFSSFWGEWTEDAVEVGRSDRSLPFFIADNSGRPLAAVPQLNQLPSTLALQQIASTFSPAAHAGSLPQLARDYVNGERTLGFQISESGLSVGSPIVAVGQLDYDKVVQASSTSRGFTSWWKHASGPNLGIPTLVKPKDLTKPFILTTQSLDDYLQETRQWAKVTRYLGRTALTLAVLMLARRAYLYYLDQRIRKRIQAMRARRRSFVSRRSLSMDKTEVAPNTEEIPESEVCVVCLENRRGIVLMPCGHFVICESCGGQIGSSCPVCREYISSKVKVYA